MSYGIWRVHDPKDRFETPELISGISYEHASYFEKRSEAYSRFISNSGTIPPEQISGHLGGMLTDAARIAAQEGRSESDGKIDRSFVAHVGELTQKGMEARDRGMHIMVIP